MTDKGWWALTLFMLCGCAQPPKRIEHDAYIWQRRWDDSLLKAIKEATPAVRAWRVLAAEVDAAGHVTPVAVNWEALRGTGKPVIAVVRMQRLVNVVQNWPVNGIEIDYDCATSQLRAYQDFLHALSGKTPLSITALPSWMDSSELPGLLDEVDESVLQVHSVMNAKKGLFDRRTAYGWARQWAGMSSKPFRIALPTYWSKVSWNSEGKVEAVESEATRYGIGDESHELFVEPGEVSAFVAELRKAPIRGLEGIAWFRLPTNEDERAWTLQTWRAVMEGRTMTRAVPVVRVKQGAEGLRDVYLQSDRDGRLPAEILVASQGCEFADAMEPYTLDRERERVRFRLRGDDAILRAGQERMVGWVRCTGKELEAHVSVE